MKKTVYENPWFQVEQDGQWHYVQEKNSDNGAMILCYVGDDLVLVEVPRAAHGAELLEAPRGYGEPGEKAVEAAARELFEETGYQASELEFLGVVKPNTAILTTNVNVFRCHLPANTQPIQHTSAASDFNEVSKVELASPKQLAHYIANGRLSCGITLAALMLASHY
ncbi:ADP-ribose pyrophosphatase [Idiomarina sp. A28L]|uniref:NUDIX hydrolase n=1 Tax=Idiomarina sp. A28L TaxID=1036674 RepID=UPI0002138DAE|nr:NUDIX hydrolase [Idiomarina sp. A28L]EGN76100.1 ADP-ribose pyrophosphatase [Idiomarina sp. A28L]